MSSERETTLTEGTGVELNAQRIMFGGGVLMAALGFLAILSPYATGLSLSILLGAILVVGGVTYVAQAFSATRWVGFAFEVILGIVYTLAGIALLTNPVLGLATLTVLLVGFFLVDGVVETVMALRLRAVRNWYWLLASGLLSILLAVLIWIEFPSSARWAVGLLFGISLLSTGISMITVSRGLKAERLRRRKSEYMFDQEPTEEGMDDS